MKNPTSYYAGSSSVNTRILHELRKNLAPILEMGCSCAVDISPFYSSVDTQNSFWRGVYVFSSDPDDHSASKRLLVALLSESEASIKCHFNLYLHPLMTFLNVDGEVIPPMRHEELLPISGTDDVQISVDKLLPKINSTLDEVDVGDVNVSSILINEASCSYFFDSNCNNIEALAISENANERRLRVGDPISYNKLKMDYLAIARLQHLTLRKCYAAKKQSLQFIYPLNSSSIGQDVKPIDFFDEAMDDSYLGGVWIYVFKEEGGGCGDKNELSVKREILKAIDDAVNALRLEIVPTLFGAKIRFAEVRENRRIREAYTQSAVGAIMSRNGSHNIGSHVLSALTHNIGTMPDDRVLYQYIQHRMDYIATATTGFPDWGVPTMFVGEIMRNFMTQHHLLDYIVESEGLHAYHFQGHKANSLENEKNTLRLKIVAKVGSEHRPFVDYGEGDIKQDVPLSDVCVSIPGGVAGHHAVYTILENVIRNAAKHGWARPDKRQSLDNLEVTVEFEDVPKDDRVLVTVYDNAPLPDEEAGKLVHSLNAKLKEKLISEETDGALRKENWGLAEMRISAAYLQQRTLPETGGLSELKDGDHIISAAVIKNGNDGCSHLGYQFFIRKPQEMLIVIPCGWKDVIKNLKANRGTAAKILALSGIRTAECKDDECFDIITGNKLQSFRYAYVVLPRQPKRQLLRSGAYPFRLLVLGGSGSLVWKPPMKKGVYDRYDREPIGPRMLPSLSPYVKEIRKLLQEVGGKSADDNCTSGFNGVDKAAFDLRTIVYNVWIQYLDKRTRTLVRLKKCDGECLRDSGKRDLNIYIDTEGGESNSGRELLSDRDVCIYLLDHSYRTILEALNKVIGKEVEKIESTEEKEAVQHQVASLFDGLEKVCFDKSTLGYDMHVRDMMRQVADQVLTLAKAWDLLEDLKRQGFNIRESLIDFLVGAFSATDAMLRKYSERIDTLPEHFCVGASTGSQKPKDEDGCDVLDGVKVISKIEADGENQNCTITYQRHAGDAIRNVYASGLSGSQSCFSQFKRFESDCNVQNKQSMLARLVENALLRVLIIDERVFKFLSIRPRSLSKLSRMNVWAVNTNMTQSEESGGEGKTESTKETCDVKDGGNHKTRSCLTVNWDHWKRVNEDGKGEAVGCQQLLPAGVFDVLVIHQGIIDKVLGNKCTKKQVELMLERLKKVVPYVVITTGRGRPTNTPASARILPFSCVERYLFQEWPEKFLLVNAIMNLLPCGE